MRSVNEGNGDGEGATGFTRYVTLEEFSAFKRDVRTALYGSEGTSGLTKDIHDIKMQLRLAKWIVGISISVVSPIITALILKYVMGV